MVDYYAFDVAAIVASIVLLLAYNIYAYFENVRFICFPNRDHTILMTQIQKNFATSYLWLEKHAEKSDPASVTLAIQTLRNTILVSTFIGTITFQTAVSIIGKYSSQTSDIDKVQVLITSICLFLSFLCWTSVIRCASHLGYQTGVISNNYTKLSKHLVGKHDAESEVLEVSDAKINMMFENETHLMTVMFLSFR